MLLLGRGSRFRSSAFAGAFAATPVAFLPGDYAYETAFAISILGIGCDAIFAAIGDRRIPF